MRGTAAIGMFIGVLCLASSANAETELKNDGFMTGGTAGFQGGFVSPEFLRVEPPSAHIELFAQQLVGVRIMFERLRRLEHEE